MVAAPDTPRQSSSSSWLQLPTRARISKRGQAWLETFLTALDIPFITTLRDTQNYIRAAERGLGIFEMAPSAVEFDLEQWQPLIKWLNSKRSMPQ